MERSDKKSKNLRYDQKESMDFKKIPTNYNIGGKTLNATKIIQMYVNISLETFVKKLNIWLG